MDLSSSGFELLLRTLLPPMGFNWRKYCRRSIRRRVLRRLEILGISSVERYIEIVRSDKVESERFYDLLTVTISRFFRDRNTFELIREVLIPEVIERDGKLSVWSIGCASGEEPYSLAILWDAYLKSVYPDKKPIIIATDIDRDCLRRAEIAVYEKSSLRELPGAFVGRYFMHERCSFALAEEIRMMVEFRSHDILKEGPLKGNNLVLSRNMAFTYFGHELQMRVLEKVHAALSPGGYLIIGRKEILPENGLFGQVFQGIYRRVD